MGDRGIKLVQTVNSAFLSFPVNTEEQFKEIVTAAAQLHKLPSPKLAEVRTECNKRLEKVGMKIEKRTSESSGKKEFVLITLIQDAGKMLCQDPSLKYEDFMPYARGLILEILVGKLSCDNGQTKVFLTKDECRNITKIIKKGEPPFHKPIKACQKILGEMVTSGLLEMDESVGRENHRHETDGRLYSLSTRGILENYVVIKTILEKLEKEADCGICKDLVVCGVRCLKRCSKRYHRACARKKPTCFCGEQIVLENFEGDEPMSE